MSETFPSRQRFLIKVPRGQSDSSIGSAFSIKAVEIGDRLLAFHNGHAPALVEITAESEIEDIEIQLESGQTIHIKVVDPKGKPVPGATLQVVGWRGLQHTILTLGTDPQGEAKSSSVPDESLVFEIREK